MQSTGFKGLLLRVGWALYIAHLILPTLLLQYPSGELIPAGGINVLIQFFIPSWWSLVPMAMPVSVGNAAMFAAIALAGHTLRQRGRMLWLGIPCLVAFTAGIYFSTIPYQGRCLIGFWFWMAGMLCCGVSALLRRRDDV